MSDKEKRKSNPRRRVLLKLILGIALIATLISVGIYTLRPKGAQIVFIAPDDNGIDQIWIADLNNPENPRQLTFHTENVIEEESLKVSEQSNVLSYISDPQNSPNEIIIISLDKAQQTTVIPCDTCSQLALSPDGQYIAYEQILFDNTSTQRAIQVKIYDIVSRESQTVYEFISDSYIYHKTFPSWVGYTVLLAFVAVSESGEYRIHNFETNSVVRTMMFNDHDEAVYEEIVFSDNGLLYTYQYWFSGISLVKFGEISTSEHQTSWGFYDPINEEQTHYMDVMQVLDWHPNNEIILTRELWYGYEDDPYGIFELNLHNLMTGDIETVAVNEGISQQAQFNADGSYILYNFYDSDAYTEQLMIYDMETGEQIALPLFGRNPQWVNGGR